MASSPNPLAGSVKIKQHVPVCGDLLDFEGVDKQFALRIREVRRALRWRFRILAATTFVLVLAGTFFALRDFFSGEVEFGSISTLIEILSGTPAATAWLTKRRLRQLSSIPGEFKQEVMWCDQDSDNPRDCRRCVHEQIRSFSRLLGGWVGLGE